MALKEEIIKRKKVIWLLLILLLLLIIAAIIYLLLFYYKISPAGVTNNNGNLNQPVIPKATTPVTFNQPNPEVMAEVQGLNPTAAVNTSEKKGATFIATSFAERFGSYSNQSNYKNLDELDSFVTDSMRKWLATYKEQLRKQNPDINTYYALETKAISTDVKSIDEKLGQGEIIVKTQRQEFKNTINNPRVFYQDLLLKMLKVDDQWKVNGAYWQ